MPNCPSKHGNDCASWEIGESLHHILLTTIKEVIMGSSFFSFFVDEAIIIDNKSWISIYCYVVATWIPMLILFTFEKLVEGGISFNIKIIIFLF